MSAIDPVPPESPSFTHDPAPWVWDWFYAQPGYPPKPQQTATGVSQEESVRSASLGL